jgi:hypothetical protein
MTVLHSSSSSLKGFYLLRSCPQLSLLILFGIAFWFAYHLFKKLRPEDDPDLIRGFQKRLKDLDGKGPYSKRTP